MKDRKIELNGTTQDLKAGSWDSVPCLCLRCILNITVLSEWKLIICKSHWDVSSAFTEGMALSCGRIPAPGKGY